jgi:hypothetical protein
MSKEGNGQPVQAWLPKFALTLLVFLALAFVVYQTTVGMDTRDLGMQRMWALIVAILRRSNPLQGPSKRLEHVINPG